MKFAILESGGKQYKVTEGNTLEVERIDTKTGEELKLNKVLFLSDDGVNQIGKPHLENVWVTARVLEQKKGPKIRVAKFKAKVRYRKVHGHRQNLTKIQITKISTKRETKKT